MVQVVHSKKEPFDIYIGRPGKWKNPFPLDDPKDEIKRGLCLTKYTEWLFTQNDLLNDIHELKDKVLGCWCAPRLCHGDVLYCLANKDKVMRIIIAGSRSFSDYELLVKNTDEYIKKNINNYQEVVIISGEAKGADLLGRRYGEEKGYKILRLPALWRNENGGVDLKAGFKRNTLMAKLGSHCICFWDGMSNGTRMMIDTANRYKLTTEVVNYDQN